MNCPKCDSTQISKNSHHHGKHCDRQFVESYDPKGYLDDVKRICLKMYLNGMGFRGIERVTGINYNTIINGSIPLLYQKPNLPHPSPPLTKGREQDGSIPLWKKHPHPNPSPIKGEGL